MKATVKVRVEGRVQGVGFRAFVASQAQRLGVVGEVWNTRDDAVEAVLQGEEADIEELLERIRNGPGRVNRVMQSPGPQAAVYSEFEISSTR